MAGVKYLSTSVPEAHWYPEAGSHSARMRCHSSFMTSGIGPTHSKTA